MKTVTGDTHQIYLFQSTSHLGMKGPQSEFPMKVLSDALKRGIFMAILYCVCLVVTCYQSGYFMKVFREILGGHLTFPTITLFLSSQQSLSVHLEFNIRFFTNKSELAEIIGWTTNAK